MSWGYQHKSPQIRQLNTPEISFLTVQKDIVRDQGVSRATLPPKGRAFLVRQLLLVAVTLVSLGWWQDCVCLWLHVAFLSACISAWLRLFLQGYQSYIGLTLIQDDIILTITSANISSLNKVIV